MVSCSRILYLACLVLCIVTAQKTPWVTFFEQETSQTCSLWTESCYGVLGLLEDTLVTHLRTRGECVSSWSPLYVPCPLQWGLSWVSATGLGSVGSARALAENVCGTEQGGTHSTGEEEGQANLPASQGRRHAGHSRFQQAAPGSNFSLEFA